MPLQPNRHRAYAQLWVEDAPVYQLTSADVLWAARVAAFEGGHPADVLWTLTQRFASARAQYPTFGAFAQAFSQTVNPDWRANGAHCRPGGDFAGTAHCSDTRLARRHRAASIGWWGLSREYPAVVDATVRWANGELTNPVPRATNFADPTLGARYLANHPAAELLVARSNWYIIEPHARGWRPDHVTLHSAGGAAAGTSILAAASPIKQALASFWGAVVQPIG